MRPYKDELRGKMINIPVNPKIKLIDFGSAVEHNKKRSYHTHLIQTRHYRAPEVMLKLNWSLSADIWSIGCIIVELVYGKMLFNTHDTIDHLNQITRCIGKIPEHLQERTTDETWNKYFYFDGRLNLSRAKRSSVQCRHLTSYFNGKQHDMAPPHKMIFGNGTENRLFF